MKKQDPLFLIVDLFCGFGGTTTGFDKATINGRKICKVIACVNHDPKAIKSHWLNHPDVKHFEEDIRTLDLTELAMHVKSEQQRYPAAKLILWASLECTNFSKAKGGQPRDADSRTLAEHLYRYIRLINPDYIQIENVVEFMSWGPLDENGKPESRKNGQSYMRWRNEICSFGYHNDWREINSADYGAYTSRNRLFGCFAKQGLPILWPKPTHSKKAEKDPTGQLLKWKPVKEVLHFENEGVSIFERKKPLSDKTLERIYAGLVKYVANGDTSFISKYYSGRPAGKVSSTDNPAGTITTAGTQSLVQTKFLLKYNSTSKKGKHIPPSVEDPAPVIAAQARLGVVQTQFLQHYYGNGFVTSMSDPCPTLRTKDGVSLIDPQFYKNYNNQSIDQPAGSVMPKDKHSIVKCDSFILNPSHGGHNTSTSAPCPVIVARQDKAPLYLLQAEKGMIGIPVYDDDTEVMIRIKQFMIVYELQDIKMRMLLVPELLKIQGFPADYKMIGNQSDQKKFIGNSVHPLVPEAWINELALPFLDPEKYKDYKPTKIVSMIPENLDANRFKQLSVFAN